MGRSARLPPVLTNPSRWTWPRRTGSPPGRAAPGSARRCSHGPRPGSWTGWPPIPEGGWTSAQVRRLSFDLPTPAALRPVGWRQDKGALWDLARCGSSVLISGARRGRIGRGHARRGDQTVRCASRQRGDQHDLGQPDRAAGCQGHQLFGADGTFAMDSDDDDAPEAYANACTLPSGRRGRGGLRHLALAGTSWSCWPPPASTARRPRGHRARYLRRLGAAPASSLAGGAHRLVQVVQGAGGRQRRVQGRCRAPPRRAARSGRCRIMPVTDGSAAPERLHGWAAPGRSAPCSCRRAGVERVGQLDLPAVPEQPGERVVAAPEPAASAAAAARREAAGCPACRRPRRGRPTARRPARRRAGAEQLEREPDRVAADVVQRATVESRISRCCRVADAEVEAATGSPAARRSPRPRAARCTAAIWAWNGKTNASHSSVPVSRATVSTCSPSASVPHSGFSHSTALPARSALIVHSACSELGSGMYTASTSGSSISAW